MAKLKKLKLMLEYKQYMLWMYDEDDQLIDSGYPLTLANKNNIENKMQKIEEEYDNLYLDDGHEFKYIGFDNKNDECIFFKKVYAIYQELSDLTRGEYLLEYSSCLEESFKECNII